MKNLFALLLIFLIWAVPIHAEDELYITIDVDGELPLEAREIISRYFSPGSLETAISSGRGGVVPASDFCEAGDCASVFQSATWRDLSSKLEKDVSETYSVSTPDFWKGQFPVITTSSGFPPFRRKKTYVLLSKNNDLVRGFDDLPESYQILAVPISVPDEETGVQKGAVFTEPAQYVALDGMLRAAWFENTKTEELAVLERDISILGHSRRQFQGPAAVITQLQAEIENIGADAINVHTHANQINDFVVENAATFLASSGECADTRRHWPFNEQTLIELLNKNQKRLDELEVPHLPRATIFTIDTGLGAALLNDQRFRQFLNVDLGQRLYADYVYTRTGGSVEDRHCLFENDASLYGYSAEDKISNCKINNQASLVQPIKTQSSDPDYRPEHGSFVSVLSLGGPEIYRKVERLDKLLGLRVGRITRNTAGAAGSIQTQILDLEYAFKYAVDRRFDVINASIKVDGDEYKRSIEKITNDLDRFEGTIVAAAGNGGGTLTSSSGVFPATAEGNARPLEKLIVVAATRILSDGNIALWPQSKSSPSTIDIAAPGHKIKSLNENGDEVCMSGTSAAAPLVAFTAALLKAYGVADAREVKRRILATADRLPSLVGKVNGARHLNINNALDVFADQIWTKDGRHIRGVIMRADRDNAKPNFLHLCKQSDELLLDTKGRIDAGAFFYWERVDDAGQLWRRIGEAGTRERQCMPPESTLTIGNFATNRVEPYELRDIKKIVPSPFRKALKFDGQ